MVHVVAVEKLAPSLVIPPQSPAVLVKADAARNNVELRTSSAVSVDVASSQQPFKGNIMVKFTASVEAKADPVMDFVICLLNSVTTAHILHLSSRSYSQHKALETFYTEIGDHVDDFVEAFQGKFGLLTKYPATADLFAEQDPITYLEYLKNEVTTLRRANGFPVDSELQNITDEIMQLIDATLYKLKFLA